MIITASIIWRNILILDRTHLRAYNLASTCRSSNPQAKSLSLGTNLQVHAGNRAHPNRLDDGAANLVGTAGSQDACVLYLVRRAPLPHSLHKLIPSLKRSWQRIAVRALLRKEFVNVAHVNSCRYTAWLPATPLFGSQRMPRRAIDGLFLRLSSPQPPPKRVHSSHARLSSREYREERQSLGGWPTGALANAVLTGHTLAGVAADVIGARIEFAADEMLHGPHYRNATLHVTRDAPT